MAGPKIRQSENSALGKTKKKLMQNPDFYLVIFKKIQKKPFRVRIVIFLSDIRYF
jgi:hypothetical protein